MRSSILSRRGSLLAAASFLGITVSAPAFAQVPDGFEPVATETIVANHTVTPGPGSASTGANYANSAQVLDPVGINGVGQQIAFIQTSPTSAGLSLCTGTLINPRTVITAAHCVSSNPAHMYGSQTGTGGGVNIASGAITSIGATSVTRAVVTSQGIPLSFGFGSTNRCLGITAGVNAALNATNTPGNGCQAETGAYEVWRNSGFQTNTALAIYNANQVWYNRNSQAVALGGGGEFANGDIALVTLDTHAQDIPTWTLLFSPLDAPTHATITGYGGAGVGLAGIGSLAGIDYRRRSAENMIDALMSWHDQNTTIAISGPTSTARIAHQHAIYWLDFDDPNWNPTTPPANFFVNTAPAGQRNNGYYDFNVFGGITLPNEGATAGGDSGGPLVVDQRWDRKVIAGVLTGSISYNGGISTYGQMNVYPPLFNFWEEIVQNNPYKYASALAGNGDWFDPTHWVQDMDPNYVVIGADGQLVNAVPDTIQGGGDGDVKRFGLVCFYGEDCSNVTHGTTPTGDGTPVVTAGGPGTLNFVPNNVEPVNSATAALNVKARYFDVTLREAGKTTLSAAATIDKLTVDGGLAKLDIAAAGDLKVWGDYNQLAGWTNVDGKLKTSEAMVMSGLLSGTGTFDPTYLTVVGGVVAPGGGDKIGTFTVKADTIMASASALFVDVMRGSSDKLAVEGNLSLSSAPTNGASVVFNKVTDGAAPRHNESFVIAQTTGGTVLGQFGTAYTFQGVLRPVLSYTSSSVSAKFVAGSLVEVLDGGSATEIAFAQALDALRSSSYTSLWNLYGSIDWMNGSQLSQAFAALKPQVLGDVEALHERQSKLLLGNVSDRLSLLAGGKAQGLTMVGNVGAAMAARTDGVTAPKLGFGAGQGSGVTVADLPGPMTGFISGGTDRTKSSYGHNDASNQGGWHMAMGLEMPISHNASIGTAAGFAEGESSPGGDSNRSRTSMAAAYGAVDLGDGFYAGGLVAVESSRASLDRQSTDGSGLFTLTGATSARRYTAVAEAGYAAGIGRGLTLTPRVQLGYGRYTLAGFDERGGETALKMDDLSVSRIEARLGAKLDGTTSIAGIAVKPQLTADYVSLLSGRETGATVRFALAPDEAIRLPLGYASSGWAEIKGGVTFGDGPFTLGLSGQHAVGAGAMSDQRAQADVKLRF